MRITIFTGSSIRHKFLINSLTNHHLSIILEDKNNFDILNQNFIIIHLLKINILKKLKKKK